LGIRSARATFLHGIPGAYRPSSIYTDPALSRFFRALLNPVQQLLNPVHSWYQYSSTTWLGLVVRSSRVRGRGSLGSSAFRYELRLRGDVVDPPEVLESDLFDVRDSRRLQITDFPGQCTTQVNARLSTPKIHQKRHFQAFISRRQQACLPWNLKIE